MQLYYSSKLCYTECINKEGEHMKQLTITIDDFLYDFYQKIGNNVGKTPEKIIEDALLRLAGELSMEAISKKGRTIR